MQPRPGLHWLAVALVATVASGSVAGDALARGRPTVPHSLHQRSPTGLQPLGQSRLATNRAAMARHQPCLVWTRQGWTDLCRMVSR